MDLVTSKRKGWWMRIPHPTVTSLREELGRREEEDMFILLIVE